VPKSVNDTKTLLTNSFTFCDAQLCLVVLFLPSLGTLLVRSDECMHLNKLSSETNLSSSSTILRSEQVFQNTMHAIVAGVVSTWWFDPSEASCCCSKAIWGSTVRATTTSFGSICFGSLLVAIIQTLRALVESARQDDDVEGCAAFLLCLVDCCLRCLEGILEYFNKFAYIYVGMVSEVTLSICRCLTQNHSSV
jgi:hypothetical protein